MAPHSPRWRRRATWVLLVVALVNALLAAGLLSFHVEISYQQTAPLPTNSSAVAMLLTWTWG